MNGVGAGETVWVEPVKVRGNMSNLKPNKPRQERSDKRERVNITTDKETHNKIRRLAFVCGMSKTMMMAEIAKIVTNNEDWVNFIQDRFKVDEEYRLTLVKMDGKLMY